MIAIIKNVNSNLNKILDLSKYNRNQKFEIYNFYKEMIPKRKVWLKYIKGSKNNTLLSAYDYILKQKSPVCGDEIEISIKLSQISFPLLKSNFNPNSAIALYTTSYSLRNLG